MIHEEQAWIDVQVAQAVHHPLGLLLAILLDQTRHDGGITGAHRWIRHVAEQEAVAIFEREPAVVGFCIAGAQFAVVQGVGDAAIGGIDLLAMLHRGDVVVVHGADVITVQTVFVLQLPVTVVAVGRLAGQYFQLARRGLRDHHVEEHFGIAQVVFQRIAAIDVQANEHEAFVAFDPGLLQAAGCLVEAFRIFARGLDLDQAAITFVAPGMERTGEGRLIAVADASQGRAPVLASIDQRVELIVAIAGDDHGLTTRTHRQKVIGVGDFTLVAGVDPVLLEDQFHLQVEQFRLGEDVAGDAVHAFVGTEVQAAADVLSPLRNVFIRSIHGWHLPHRAKQWRSLEGALPWRVYPLGWQTNAKNFGRLPNA
ncbi:hypothetical protein D9M71_186720 [compost metagenome]